MLDLPVGNFYLATGLRMVRSGYLMSNGVLEKQGFKKPVAKVLASVTDNGPVSTKSAEDVGLDEFHYHFVIIGVRPTKMYSYPKDGGKGPMKSIPQMSKISTIRMGFNGIISLRDIAPSR
jgi:hypothetical protein